MKQDIHPNYNKIKATCVCGASIETGSVLDAISVEICSSCHPFFTGQQKIIDTEGRVDKFNKRYGKKSA
ncbi:MAG: 50S ribosomal protein L31 [Vampirovibrionales bacterium]